MKKLLILFMAFGLVAASCNNDKGKAPNISKDKDRDRDDYNSRDDEDKDDRNKDRDDEDEDFSSGGWSSSDKRQWMKMCKDPLAESMGESRATDYCECVMDKISKKYSSFKKMNTQGTEEEGQELGLECVRELGFQ